ncbi:MAG: tetratricopeptide repeat protein [Gemmataceae bacterium]|nr:tetratricopeptide repeat protein [Gemmataceae bacterium]
MTQPSRTRAAVVALLLAAGPAGLAQPPDQQAALLLTTARKAYADANPQAAADKFNEFLQKFGGHKDAPAARYGLGLALLDLPNPDRPKAIEALGPPANDPNFPDRPAALYYLAAAHHGQGLKELAEAAAKPNEADGRRKAAEQRFNDAARFFAQSREQFEKKGDADGAARSRADQADAELRANKPKDARATAEPFAKDPALAKSPSRPLGLYRHGLACFQLNDLAAAGRSLGLLAPWDQPFGPHARYLLGRVHAEQGERAEAAAAFDAVVAEYTKQKQAAQEALKQPDRFKADPWEKARLEALVKSPPPDHVAGSAFHAASLGYEAGRFGDALARFQAFPKDYPQSPLKDDAALRAGLCQVQLKQYDEAAKTLQPLTNNPRLADQALLWLGKSQAGQALTADPNNPNARKDAFNRAVQSLRAAADKANAQAAADPTARTRRADILLDLGDTLAAAGQAPEAVNVYQSIWNEKLLPARNDEVLQRLVAALHLAGDLAGSDARISEFRQQFPQSPLTPAVLFRGAENAYARAAKLAKDNKPEAKAAFADAGKKYEEVVGKFPEFERASRARFGLALCLVAAGEYEKAVTVLEAVPAPERVGDLAGVAVVLADCHIRTAPAKAEDALQDNVLREKLGAAAGLLDGFVSANPKDPGAADALVKFGVCQRRLAQQFPPGNERNDLLSKARAAVERVPREYGQSPVVGAAALERAKVMALQGDKGGAAGQLAEFRKDPLGKSPVAPLAYIALATHLREQNQAQPAADVMKEARDKFSEALKADPERKEWGPLLRYHQGLALLAAGKPAEARPAFERVVEEAKDQPVAVEAALRACQCQADDARKKLAEAEKGKADDKVKAAKAELREAAKAAGQRADGFKEKHPQAEARARLLYDAAWALRAAGDDPAPAYAKLIAEFPDRSLAVDARLELAEHLADKGKPDEAVKLLKEALDAEPADGQPSPDTADRLRLRLGAALFAAKDVPAAKAQFETVAGNAKSPHRAAALYRLAECLIADKKWDEAAKKLAVFRDDGAFHNVPGVSDRAMLRLGTVLAELKQWDPARQAFEAVPGRYGDGNPWAPDARYGAGWTLQNQGRYDEAVNAYGWVTQRVTDDRAGRAQLGIGLCRAAQKRWADAGQAFAAVYYGYDLPELKYAALVEHARALLDEKKPAEAAKLLEKVAKDAPADSPWAKAVKELAAKAKP